MERPNWFTWLLLFLTCLFNKGLIMSSYITSHPGRAYIIILSGISSSRPRPSSVLSWYQMQEIMGLLILLYSTKSLVQYIPRNMHTVFALLCFVVVIHWLIFPYPSGLLHWHCGNLTIAPVPAKQPWWIWINTSYELIMNDCITTTKQSTTKPCAYFLGYTLQQPRIKD